MSETGLRNLTDPAVILADALGVGGAERDGRTTADLAWQAARRIEELEASVSRLAARVIVQGDLLAMRAERSCGK